MTDPKENPMPDRDDVTAYRVRPNQHSRAFPWQWECLHSERVGCAPRPARCSGRGLARTKAEGERLAARHVATHPTP